MNILEPHGIDDVYYEDVRNKLRNDRCISCDCGFVARGETWAAAGAVYDAHIEPQIKKIDPR